MAKFEIASILRTKIILPHLSLRRELHSKRLLAFAEVDWGKQKYLTRLLRKLATLPIIPMFAETDAAAVPTRD